MNRVIYLAGGCFWNVQDYFNKLDGIVETYVGYANGNLEKPTYLDVCSKQYGHVEVVKIKYDEDVISIDQIINSYLTQINPYRLNENIGSIKDQYRNGIYTEDAMSLGQVFASLLVSELKALRRLNIEVEILTNYYQAEEEHQNYFEKNPNAGCKLIGGN